MANLRVPVNYQSPYNSGSLITHLAGATLSVCVCAYIASEVTTQTVAITSWSSDLTGVPGYSGVTFRSTTGITASKVEHAEGTQAANMETDVFLVAAGITEADVLAGVWSHAAATIFVTNYEAVNMGQLVILAGNLGQFAQKGPMLTTEVQAYSNALSAQIGKVTRPECHHDFGDSGCTVDLTPHTKTGTLTSVTSQLIFADSARSETADYFQNGKLRFTSGVNNNLGYFQIDSWDATNKAFTLRRGVPYLPGVGDSYTAIRGCRKRMAEDCVTKFSNGLNFGGFPHIDTAESMVRLPSI